jgi:hypothetical protein
MLRITSSCLCYGTCQYFLSLLCAWRATLILILGRSPPPARAEEKSTDIWELIKESFEYTWKIIEFIFSIECMVLLLLSWAAVYIVSFEAFKMCVLSRLLALLHVCCDVSLYLFLDVCRSFSLPVDVVALFCIVPMILGATIAFEKRENVSR